MRSIECDVILGTMRLQIVIEALDPPRGHGLVDGRFAWTFAGWMELIEKVEKLKEERGSPQLDPQSASSP